MSLMPSDVRGINGNRSVAQPNGEAAHGAPVDVGLEYATPKRGIPAASARFNEVSFDAHRPKDLAVARPRKVRVQQANGQPAWPARGHREARRRWVRLFSVESYLTH